MEDAATFPLPARGLQSNITRESGVMDPRDHRTSESFICARRNLFVGLIENSPWNSTFCTNNSRVWLRRLNLNRVLLAAGIGRNWAAGINETGNPMGNRLLRVRDAELGGGGGGGGVGIERGGILPGNAYTPPMEPWMRCADHE